MSRRKGVSRKKSGRSRGTPIPDADYQAATSDRGTRISDEDYAAATADRGMAIPENAPQRVVAPASQQRGASITAGDVRKDEMGHRRRMLHEGWDPDTGDLLREPEPEATPPTEIGWATAEIPASGRTRKMAPGGIAHEHIPTRDRLKRVFGEKPVQAGPGNAAGMRQRNEEDFQERRLRAMAKFGQLPVDTSKPNPETGKPYTSEEIEEGLKRRRDSWKDTGKRGEAQAELDQFRGNRDAIRRAAAEALQQQDARNPTLVDKGGYTFWAGADEKLHLIPGTGPDKNGSGPDDVEVNRGIADLGQHYEIPDATARSAISKELKKNPDMTRAEIAKHYNLTPIPSDDQKDLIDEFDDVKEEIDDLIANPGWFRTTDQWKKKIKPLIEKKVALKRKIEAGRTDGQAVIPGRRPKTAEEKQPGGISGTTPDTRSGKVMEHEGSIVVPATGERSYNKFATAIKQGIDPDTGEKLTPVEEKKIKAAMKYLETQLGLNG